MTVAGPPARTAATLDPPEDAPMIANYVSPRAIRIGGGAVNQVA
jgi:hypothetical protein